MNTPPPKTAPEGYELVPCGERITRETKVLNIKKQERVLLSSDLFGYQINAPGDTFPYGYYCRPIKGPLTTDAK